MRDERFDISAGAIIAAALIYYLLDTDELFAILIPVAVHELGHIIALRLSGLKIRGFKAEIKGLCINYAGYADAWGQALSAAAGPIAGLLYALAAAFAGKRFDSQWLELTAGVSLLLSVFNALPALPLDGGRMLSAAISCRWDEDKAERALYYLGLAIGTALLGFGLWLMLKGYGVAPALAGVWLLMEQNCAEGIVKTGEML